VNNNLETSTAAALELGWQMRQPGPLGVYGVVPTWIFNNGEDIAHTMWRNAEAKQACIALYPFGFDDEEEDE
jgi:hypothetical protein